MEDIDQQISEISVLEAELAQVENELRSAEQKIQATVGGSALGGISFLAGLSGFFFYFDLWYLWGILLVAGGLGYLGAKLADRRYKREIAALREQISVLREQLSAKQANLATQPRLRK